MPDVVIVGGAAMGAATAYHLAGLDPDLDIAVYERDFTLKESSTVRSDGNVRIQFNVEENIRMSQHAMVMLEDFDEVFAVGADRPDPGKHRQGNLFLTDEASRAQAQAGLERQQSLGCDVRWLDAGAIAERWPLYSGEGFVGGTFGPDDGIIDPNALVRGFKNRSIEMGVRWYEAEVAALAVEDGRIAGVKLADGETVEAATVVNAAGAWSLALCDAAGVHLPVEPVMRSVFVVGSPLRWEGSMPCVFLPSGLYVIPEGDGTFLMGWSQPDDPIGFDFTVDRSRFYDLIWPELIRHLPAFDALEVKRSWAGIYAMNTFDGNGIIGEWPELPGLYVCTGFSGHGFQQCHAVGRFMAERITGVDPIIDLTRFEPGRIAANEPVFEHEGRLI